MQANSDYSKESASVPEAKTANASIFTAVVSTVVYLYMFGVFVITYLFSFIAPENKSWLPFKIFDYNVNQNASNVGTVGAVAIDIGLFLMFGFFHSLFARNSVKKAMNIPSSLERSFFVLQAAGLMHIQMYFWKGFGTPTLWNVKTNAGVYAVMGVQLFGIVFLLTASFALDHFHLFGLSQGFGIDINKALRLNASDHPDSLVRRWHYALVAHPLMTGLMIAFWATPKMTGSHLLFASINTLYILHAVKYLEEPQLEEMVGPEYSQYLEEVPRYIPFAKGICPGSSDGATNDEKTEIGGDNAPTQSYQSTII